MEGFNENVVIRMVLSLKTSLEMVYWF